MLPCVLHPFFFGADLYKLGRDAYRNLFRCFCADVDADGRMYLVDIGLREPIVQHMLVDGLALFFAANHTDIRGACFKCFAQDKLVVYMASCDDDDIAVSPEDGIVKRRFHGLRHDDCICFGKTDTICIVDSIVNDHSAETDGAEDVRQLFSAMAGAEDIHGAV